MRGAVQLQSAKTSGRDDYCTPPDIMKLIGEHWHVELDPCSNEFALTSPTIMALGGGEDGDGLLRDWRDHIEHGIAYVNPPYSQAKAWADKVALEAACGVPIVALVAARTDTRWWRTLWPNVDACAFWNKRIKFWLDGAPASHPATFASAFLGMNVSQRVFRRAFDGVATVVVP